jgi:hypothetical protein
MKKPELPTIKVTKLGEIFGFYGRKILKIRDELPFIIPSAKVEVIFWLHNCIAEV